MPSREAMTYTQKNRLFSVITPLGQDALLLRGFHGEDGISQLFRYELDLFSTDDRIDFDKIVGKNITVRLALHNNEQRYFNGIVSRFSQGGRDQNFTTYHAEIVPSFYLLTRTTDCRIFQHKTTPEIIKEVLKDYASAIKYLDKLQGTFTQRDYCVQYRETDFHFLSRLMEEEGIFYYFTHDNGVHTLVLANTNDGLPDCPHQPQARYHHARSGSNNILDEDTVADWNASQELRPGAYTLNDFNFEDPNASLEAHVPGRNTHEVYDYPGLYRRQSEGAHLARLRLQECEAHRVLIHGSGDCRAFTSGHKFKLTNHYRQDQNHPYLIVRVQHMASQSNAFRSGGNATQASLYHNTFECIPLATPFRPLRVTPKPIIQGSQTAIVSGEKGEEITTDKYGRVKVQFHWDRDGQRDEKSSCWIRVAQLVAGKSWGGLWLPRVGQEVVVHFLEGDPDQPLILGSVYNAEQMPPYELPGEKTKSTLKSNSTKGGAGFNEIRFEDKKGKEQIFLHAERNVDIRVKKDHFTHIAEERHEITGKNHYAQVDGDQNLTIKGDQNQKIDGTVSLTVGADLQEKVTDRYALKAGSEIHLKSGINVVIESGTALTLKVGGNFININPAGVFLSGTMIYLNSGGSPSSGAGATPQPPTLPKEADNAQPGKMAKQPPTPKVERAKPTVSSTTFSPMAHALRNAHLSGVPLCVL